MVKMKGNSGTDEKTALISRSAVEMIERNMFEYYFAMARASGDQMYDGDDLKWICTGSLVYNRIFGADFHESATAEKVKSALSRFKVANFPVAWYVGDGRGPSNLGAALEANGMVNHKNWTGMSYDLGGAPDFFKSSGPNLPSDHQNVSGYSSAGGFGASGVNRPDSSRLTIVKVADRRTLLRWIEVAAKSFQIPDALYPQFMDYYIRIGLGGSLPWDYYIGFYEGRPAASGKLYRGAKTAGIYFIGTLPEFRRLGISKKMMGTLLSAAGALGYGRAILQASDMGYPVYRKLGFEEICRIRIFTWTPQIVQK